MHRYMTVRMSDGSVYGVPVEMIARDRAKHYAHEFDGDIERSLNEDTLPLFSANYYEIEDWASNNMSWTDFDGHQVKLKDAPAPNFGKEWSNAEKYFSD